MKITREQIREKCSNIYHKPAVFVIANISGIFIAFVGIIVCIAMVVGSYMLQSTVKNQSETVETTLVKYLDKADDGLDKLQAVVDAFEPAENIVQEVSDVTATNIERLETLRATMTALNFGDNLDTPIARLDDTIDALEKFQDVPQFILEQKEKIDAKITELKDKVQETRDQVNDGATKVRRISLYTFLASFILAGVFFVGEYTLLTRCIAGLKDFRRQRRANKADSDSDMKPVDDESEDSK